MAGLKTTISIANLNEFKMLVSLVKEVLSDVRIDEDIRNEYIVKLGEILEQVRED